MEETTSHHDGGRRNMYIIHDEALPFQAGLLQKGSNEMLASYRRGGLRQDHQHLYLIKYLQNVNMTNVTMIPLSCTNYNGSSLCKDGRYYPSTVFLVVRNPSMRQLSFLRLPRACRGK
jgi:hypothetical protein